MKKRGFTIVELLGVITILAIIVSISLIVKNNMDERARKEYYKTQERLITLAGKDYYADHRNELPLDIGPTSQVLLETLINENYIDPVVDERNNPCYVKDSYVVVQKSDVKDYNYYTYLKCPNYDSAANNKAPTITYNPNSKKGKDAITVTINMQDDMKVVSYQYNITKDGQPYQSTGLTAYQGKVTIYLHEDGVYRITTTAFDNYGKSSTKESGKYIIDSTPPDCTQVTFSTTSPKETWQSNNVDLSITMPEDMNHYEWYTNVDGGSYSKKSDNTDATTKTLSANGIRQGKVKVYDEAGNSCEKTTDRYYIDKTIPEVTLTGSTPNGKLTNKDVRLIADVTPPTTPSGYTYVWYKEVNGIFQEIGRTTTNTYTVTETGKNNYKVEVITGAGKKASSNTYEVNIDKTPPDCTTGVTITSSKTTGTWYDQTIDLNVGIKSSDIKTWDFYSRIGSNNYSAKSYNNVGDKTVYLENPGESQGKVRAYDEAGNYCEKETGKYYIDNTNPSVTITGSVGSGVTTAGSVYLTARINPTTIPSGVTYQWQYQSGSSWVNIGSNSSTYTASGVQDRWYRVKITTGMGKTAYSNQYRVIIEAREPNCSGINISGSPQNTWTKNNITVTASIPSSSNIDYWYIQTSRNGGSYSNASSKNTGTSGSYTISGDGTYQVRVVGYNANGSCTSTISGNYMRDTTGPSTPTSSLKRSYNSQSLSLNTSSSYWYPYGVTWYNFSSSDSGSGVDHFEYAPCSSSSGTTAYSSSTVVIANGTQKNYKLRAVDKLGNTSSWTSCYYFNIDANEPSVSIGSHSCSIKGGTEGDPSGSTSTYSGACLTTASFPVSVSDTGGSGFNRFTISSSGGTVRCNSSTSSTTCYLDITSCHADRYKTEKFNMTVTVTAYDKAGNTATASKTIAMSNGWYKNGTSWNYYDCGSKITGLNEIYWGRTGTYGTYYFNTSSGNMQVGFITLNNGKIRYFRSINDSVYYQNGTKVSDQIAQGQRLENGTFKINGTCYKFDANGYRSSGSGCK